MRKARRIIPILILLSFILVTITLAVYAHSGKTDSNGGHTDHDTGEYHYHHGYPSHDHYDMDGDGDRDCPYNFDDKTDHSPGEGANNAPPGTGASLQSSSVTKKVTFGDILNETLLIAIFAVALFYLGMLCAFFLSHLFCHLLGEKAGGVTSLVVGSAISVVSYIWTLIQVLTSPWPLLLLLVSIAAILVYVFWDKLKYPLGSVGKVLLFIVAGIAAIAAVCAVVVGLFALLNYVDSPILYGIFGILLVGFCIVWLPLNAYRSGKMGTFIAILGLYALFLILILRSCTA